MDEVTALSEAAVSSCREGMTGFGFVGSVVLHVNAKLLWAVGELAFSSVGTLPSFGVILAE
jgi:hypothetical protein